MGSIPMVFNTSFTVKPCSSRGQGLNEYILVGGLVVIVALIGLTALGGNVNRMFSTMIGQNTNVNNDNNPSLVGLGGGGNPPDSLGGNGNRTGLLANGNALADLGVRQVETTLPNGQTYTASIPNPNDLMETLGPNGVTDAYLTGMVEYIQALRASLPADDPLQGQLAQLANLGHGVKADQAEFISRVATTDPIAGDNIVPSLAIITCTVPACNPEAAPPLTTTSQAQPENNLTQFFQLAQTLQSTLNDRNMGGSNALLSYYSGNIINTTNLLNSTLLQAGSQAMRTRTNTETGNARTVTLASSYQSALRNFGNTADYIEVNANGICGMSQQNTCYQANGQPLNGESSASPSNTTPEVTHAGVGEGKR